MRYPILALISIGNPKSLNCVSPHRGCFSVKIERFQIKQNVPNLKRTLVEGMNVLLSHPVIGDKNWFKAIKTHKIWLHYCSITPFVMQNHYKKVVNNWIFNWLLLKYSTVWKTTKSFCLEMATWVIVAVEYIAQSIYFLSESNSSRRWNKKVERDQNIIDV